jgi:autotransporter-associated beta strand protein
VVNGTRLWTTDNNSGYALGNGSTVNIPEYSQAWLDRSATAYNQVFNIAGNGYLGDFPELGALRLFGCTLNGEINLLANARIGGTISSATIVAPIKGAFQLDLLGNADFQLSVGPTNGTHTYASTLVTRGWFRALNANAISPGPLTLDVAGGLRLNGNNLTVASLTDINSGIVTGNGAQVQNSHGSVAAILTVGTDNSSTMFNGVFGNGAGGALGLTKVGTGTLTLSAAHTNSGAVTVNGGTLALVGDGAFDNAARIIVGSGAFYDVTGASGTLNLNSGQTLGGSGTVNGNVVSTPGSIIAPGTSVGTLTVAGNINLGGGMTMELNRSLTPNSDRLVTTGGSITGGGTLTVTNIGPALQVGDTFQLFASGVPGITANLPAEDSLNGVAYTWQDNLAANGSITVLSVESIAPPTLGVVQTGNTLTFTWEGAFKLQAQTNTLATGLSSNWGDYPGGGSSPVNVTIDPANPTVFFRLSSQ